MATATVIPYTIRIPADLHERLVQVARENDRSLHAEIIRTLRLSLEAPRG